MAAFRVAASLALFFSLLPLFLAFFAPANDGGFTDLTALMGKAPSI